MTATLMKFPEKKLHHPETGARFTAALLPGDGPAWLKDARQNALARFHSQGLPTAKLERWGFTNIASKLKNFSADLSFAHLKLSGAVDYAATLADTLEKGWVKDMVLAVAPGDARFQDMALWHLNAAYLRDGAVVDVPNNTKLPQALEIDINAPNDGFISPRLLIQVGDHSELTIIERHAGEGLCWNNAVAQIRLGKNAVLRHYRVENYSAAAAYTQNTHVEIAEGGVYEAFTLTHGAGVTRNQIHAEIKGPNAACNLYGLKLLSGKQHADSTWLIEHQEPNCTSNQFVRSLIGGEAHGVFQGKVHVHRPAQKTDGYQLSNALLLSDRAQMDTKPELEIYADDVKCSHGATTGQLEEEPLFYLRSRGLSEAEARFLMVNAFVAEVTEKLGDQDFAADIQSMAETWLRNAL